MVVIIAIISSFVLLSIDVTGNDRDLDREARRMVSLVQTAADEAELQGRDFGIEFILDGYRFVEYDPVFDVWAEVIGDDVMRPRTLPEPFEFVLAIEGKQIRLQEQYAELEEGEEPDEDDRASRLSSPHVNKFAPHAMILSSGDVSPFDILILRPDDGLELPVRVMPSGRLVIGEDDPDNG